jgi:DNA polymerase sigma
MVFAGHHIQHAALSRRESSSRQLQPHQRYHTFLLQAFERADIASKMEVIESARVPIIKLREKVSIVPIV